MSTEKKYIFMTKLSTAFIVLGYLLTNVCCTTCKGLWNSLGISTNKQCFI